jgi:hypothetical protein
MFRLDKVNSTLPVVEANRVRVKYVLPSVFAESLVDNIATINNHSMALHEGSKRRT